MTEFKYLRTQTVEPLSTFLDFITYEYMIENVMLLLKGALSGRDINELLAQCHPLGMFKDSTMRSIPTFENTSKGYADLYQTVLVDTPVGPYFAKFLQESAQHRGADSRHVLEEVEIEIIKSSLVKYWIEDFYGFVMSLGGDTAEIMGELLRVRADTNAINITLNSFGTPLNEPAMRTSDRKRLYPAVGNLYPPEPPCWRMFPTRMNWAAFWNYSQRILPSGISMLLGLVRRALMMPFMSVMFLLWN